MRDFLEHQGVWFWPCIVLLIAGGLVVSTRYPAVCNAQAQGMILGITAAVAAYYAWATWHLFRATKASAEASQVSTQLAVQTARLMVSSELFAWRVRDDKDQNGNRFSVYRLHNTGKGAALNVCVHPMWGGWTDTNANLGIEIATSQRSHERLPGPAQTSSVRLPVMPQETFGHFGVFEHHSEDDTAVMCVRWDDQSPGRGRRWRCWQVIIAGWRTENDGARIPILERNRIEQPVGGCDTWCPEALDLGFCPHILRTVLRQYNPCFVLWFVAEFLYGSED